MADTTPTTITGPAVTVDGKVLRAWLDQPAGTYDNPSDETETFTLAEGLGIPHLDVDSTNAVTSMLDDVLRTLREDDEQDAFTIADDVESVDIIRAYDGEGSGCDGVHVYVDLANGVRLASLHLDRDALVHGNTDPVEVVVATVAAVATEANALVAKYQAAIAG